MISLLWKSEKKYICIMAGDVSIVILIINIYIS